MRHVVFQLERRHFPGSTFTPLGHHSVKGRCASCSVEWPPKQAFRIRKRTNTTLNMQIRKARWFAYPQNNHHSNISKAAKYKHATGPLPQQEFEHAAFTFCCFFQLETAFRKHWNLHMQRKHHNSNNFNMHCSRFVIFQLEITTVSYVHSNFIFDQIKQMSKSHVQNTTNNFPDCKTICSSILWHFPTENNTCVEKNKSEMPRSCTTPRNIF